MDGLIVKPREIVGLTPTQGRSHGMRGGTVTWSKIVPDHATRGLRKVRDAPRRARADSPPENYATRGACLPPCGCTTNCRHVCMCVPCGLPECGDTALPSRSAGAPAPCPAWRLTTIVAVGAIRESPREGAGSASPDTLPVVPQLPQFRETGGIQGPMGGVGRKNCMTGAGPQPGAHVRDAPPTNLTVTPRSPASAQ